MILKCEIDGTEYSFNENSDKPLKRILEENFPFFPSNSRCTSAKCGNCLVIFNGNLRYSCLIPAFEANNSSIKTFDGFVKTRAFHDIERAYEQVGTQPCSICFKAKTLVIESLVSKMENLNQGQYFSRNRQKLKTLDKSLIEKELDIIPCKCIELPEIEKIVNLAYAYRSSRNARKSQIS